MDKYHTLNGSNLAYIGDAYYELMIRTYLIDKGITKSNELRKAANNYVSAHAHANIYRRINHLFTEQEIEIFKRGRNNFSKAHRKNMDLGEYSLSSGIEALIGYLYLKKENDRLNFLISKMIEAAEVIE